MFDYSKLPDGINYDEWRRCLIEFLFDYENNITEENKMYALEQLEEIAWRETYEVLDDEVKKAISSFLLSNIDYEDFEIMDTVTGIILSLGLKSVWDEILLKKDSISNNKVVELIEECDEKYGAHVEDPYWDYKIDITERQPNVERVSLFKFIKDKFICKDSGR